MWGSRGGRPPLADHPEGPQLRSHRRHRRGGHDVAARARGRRANWDYRYCWLRDATFTLLAFINAGYREEAEAWRDWLMRAVAGSPDQMQIMYGLAGERG